MKIKRPVITELSERSREIFQLIVEAFVDTGEPVGSRTLSKHLSNSLSPTTIRNVMADLEDNGLLYSPHTSAGRLPSDVGLRMFVDGLLEVGNLTSAEQTTIDSRFAGTGRSLETVLAEATTALAGLSQCAGLVFAPKTGTTLKHIEFVNLSPGRALVVMVTSEGVVENRLVDIPPDVPSSALIEATNYLSERLVGRTLSDAREEIMSELNAEKAQIDSLSAKVVEAGLATWAGGDEGSTLIMRGQAHLLDDITAMEDLERIRALFAALETNEMMLRVLELADSAEGVQIFIGAENELFNLSGCSIIVAPYHSSRQQLIGAIGVIGPRRMNYARIIPMVDYTAEMIERIIG